MIGDNGWGDEYEFIGPPPGLVERLDTECVPSPACTIHKEAADVIRTLLGERDALRAEVERLRAEKDASYPNCRGESAERHKRFLEELNAAHNRADEDHARAEQMTALVRELAEALADLMGDGDVKRARAVLARAQEALREGGGA